MLASSSRPSPYQVAFVLGEMLLMGAGTVLALWIRLPDPAAELFTWRYSWHRVVLVPLVLQATFYYFDLQNFRIARPFVWTIARVAQAMAVGLTVLAVIYYLVPRLYLGRGVLVLCFFTISTLVLLWRGLYAWALRQQLFSTRVALVGSGSMADSILEELVSRSDNVYNVVCLVNPADPDDPAHPCRTHPIDLMEAWARLLKTEVRHDTDNLEGLVRYYQADLVVVAMDQRRGCMPLKELLRCRMLGVPVMQGEDFFEAIAGRILAEHIKTSWLIFSPGFHTSPLRRFTKRAFDIFFSLLGLILSSPLALLTALAIRLEGPGPILYRQERVGQYGRVFTIYKFRSMVPDAEEHTGPVWAREGDQRVTRVGRVIRRLRLDEIPQLWNVLKGDMSFVGPRPERPHFVERLQARLPYYAERHNVKPGVTGWAQTCYPYGASEAAALEKLNYDLYYIKHSSLSLDLLILVQTIRLLLFGGGGR